MKIPGHNQYVYFLCRSLYVFTFHFICSYNAVEFVHNSKFAPTAYTAGRLIQNSTPDTPFDTLLSSQQCLQLQNKLQQIWHTRIQQRGTAAFCFAYRFFTRNDLPLQTDCYIPQLLSPLLSHCMGQHNRLQIQDTRLPEDPRTLTYATTTNLFLRILNSESQLAVCGSDVFSCLTAVKCALTEPFKWVPVLAQDKFYTKRIKVIGQ